MTVRMGKHVLPVAIHLRPDAVVLAPDQNERRPGFGGKHQPQLAQGFGRAEQSQRVDQGAVMVDRA